MPRNVERKLLATARRRHYGRARTGAYVYGTLRTIERGGGGGKGTGTGMAHRGFLARLRGFAFGKKHYHTRYNSGPNGEEPHGRRRIGFRGRAGRLRAAKASTREGRYERVIYDRKDIRGGWGHGYAKTKTGKFKRGKGEGVPWKASYKLSAEEKKEEARIAARRRYHAKHPGSKYRKGLDSIPEKNAERDLIHPIYSERWGIGPERRMRRVGKSRFRKR